MHKVKTFALIALAALFTIFLVSSVSAYSIWEPKYETYRLGSASHTGAYSSTSTYEKVVVENEDRFGSESTTTIKKTESETYVPTRTSSRNRYYNNNYYYDDRDYDTPRFIYSDSYGRTQYYDTDYDTYVRYDNGEWYPSSNWRFKETYRVSDYPYENEYGYSYYYEPRYDWHLGVFNWRY